MTFDIAKIREIWDRLADAWDRNRAVVWRFTRGVSEHLIRRLDPKPGETILEVGTGPGDTGFLIAEQLAPGGTLIGTDLSPNMLERARAAADRLGLSNVELRVMDAMALELPDASVDGVVGRFVYHLLPDPARAFAEARRVLRPGGRLCFAVFGPDEEMRFDGALNEANALRGLSLPPGISIDIDLNEPGIITTLLTKAGFSGVEVDEVPFIVDFPDADEMWRYIVEMYGRQAELIRSLSSDEQLAFRETLLEQLAPYCDDAGAYAIPAMCLSVRARA
ncbi:MAG TPA: methyltransferase domain-containing protein [Actinomycetota bacterium]